LEDETDAARAPAAAARSELLISVSPTGRAARPIVASRLSSVDLLERTAPSAMKSPAR
jgi:hypothetical protein